MVFYRKYRPQKIDDLDSEAVRQSLTSVLSQSVPPHAFLFTGPKGLGKTSTARIIAKVVNCTGRQFTVNNSQLTTDKKKLNVKSQLSTVDSIEPCNKCEQCVSITNGTNMDILEIDAASNRGIDEIRDLKEKIRLSPSSAKMKVYIIDEVHMLTTEAFNALLKTLEEPPPHAMFILCTTEPQKVPATIVSRCFHISFLAASKEELIRAFKRIVKAEKLDIESKALETIAELSEGGFRDGTKILEEVSLLSNGQKITQKIIDERYNISNIKSKIDSLLKSLEEYDAKTALRVVSDLVTQGIDMRLFIQQLIDELHIELLFQVENNKIQKLKLGINDIKSLLLSLQKAYFDTKYAVLSQLPLEITIIEWSHTNSEQIRNTKSTPDGTVANAINSSDSASIVDLRKQVGNIKKVQAMYGAPSKKTVPKSDQALPEDSAKVSANLLHASADGDLNKEWMLNLWNNIISEMKVYNHTIAGVLRGCSIGSYDKKTLVIVSNYKFHKERLDDIKIKNELSRVAKMLTGKDVTVEVQLRSNN